MQKLYFEDFHVGDSFDLGSISVTQEEIIDFARQFDPQVFHIDPEQAKHSFFGELVASGWHTGALLMRLLVAGLFHKVDSMGSPGVDELRFLKAVRPGDSLSGCFTVIETRPSKSRPYLGIIRARSTLHNQHGEQVLSMVSTHFFGCRPAEHTNRESY
ncbi:MAG TPA: MaoC family dehydratase [Ktedonobacteraceae bacterium]|nr:MaoC family dehydratase [Ktedonobacteraceae bacterium]